MKIEKVNDNQIRCTLTKKELEQRNLKLSEIAYGNEKVKALFRDMMRIASLQYGFEAEDIPLMIEVIPFADCAVVIITKVEDPDELDTRFSRFAPSVHGEDGPIATISEMISDLQESSDGIMDLFKKIQQQKTPEETKPIEQAPVTDDDKTLCCYFSFESLGDVIEVAHVLKNTVLGNNSLYKDTAKGTVLLKLCSNGMDKSDFLRICNLVSEYGKVLKDNGYLHNFIGEHMELLVEQAALESLSEI